MPCFCYYEPKEEARGRLKDLCMQVVAEVRAMERIGEPLGCSMSDVHTLLDHLYDPAQCEERDALDK